jgi:hypothetical protein
MIRSLSVLSLAVVFVVACGGRPRTPAAGPRLKLHDDLSLVVAKGGKVSEEPPSNRYDVRLVEETLAPGRLLRIRVATKVLDERERAAIAADPNAIGAIWEHSGELAPSDLVSHITERAWQMFDFDPSGLAHDDFEGGHSTYRTPDRVTLTVVFVHHGALIVVHASVESEYRGHAADEDALVDEFRPILAGVMERLQR